MTAFVDVRRAVRAWAEERSSRRFREASEAERVSFELFERDVLVGTLVGRTGKHVTLAPGAGTTWRWSATEAGRDVLGHAAQSTRIERPQELQKRPRRPPLPPSLVDSLSAQARRPPPALNQSTSTELRGSVEATRGAPVPAVTSIDDDPRSAFLRAPRRPLTSPHAESSPPHETLDELAQPFELEPASAPTGAPLDAEVPEPARTVLAYLRKHGSAQESDLIQLLGSPRAVRKFSLQADEIGISIESVSGVKVYRMRR